MKIIGLKYTGSREEGISVMLFRSYKTARITKTTPYRFTEKDKVDAEACNYYNKLAKLGIEMITSESDFPTKVGRRATEVRKEPLAAEIDVQLDVTAEPKSEEDQMISEEINDPKQTESEDHEDSESNDGSVTEQDSGEEITHTSSEFSVDKDAIRSMSASELGEYLEMNLNRDQIKALINDLGLDISVGRKGVPSLISEVLSAASTDSLIDYLCK